MPLTCRNVQHLFDAYLDGELTAQLLAEVEAHLLQCPECQRQIDLVRAAGSLIATDRVPSLSDSFAERVLSRVPEMGAPSMVLVTRRQRRRIFIERAVASFVPAMAAMIAFCAIILPSRSPAPTGSTNHRLVAGWSEYGPAEAFGVRSFVEPTIAGVASTGRVAGQIRGLYRVAVNQPASDSPVEPSPPANLNSALLTDLLHPFLEITAPPPTPADTTSDELVRF